MLTRKVSFRLDKWKKNHEKLPLVLRGARQVGKTFSVREFAKTAYQSLIELNFIERPSYKDIFSGDLDADTILKQITLLVKGANLESGQTLLFLDEIQECAGARTALKFLAHDSRVDVIASGSLLGMNQAQVVSFPVGYVDHLEMHSLDLEEYCWACRIDPGLPEDLRSRFEGMREVPAAVHKRMLDLFREYMVIGGMPAVVQAFVDHMDFAEALRLQRGIVTDYLDDIAKYAPGAEKNRARACLLSVPKQLSKDYKKFQYSLVEKGSTARKYGGSLLWLFEAGIISYCHNLTLPQLPFEGYAEEDNFKVFMRDTGLLVSMLDDGAQADVMGGNMGIYKGALYENIIADILTKSEKKLYSFSYRQSLQMDFFIRFQDKATAIEVKSAENRKAKSLGVLMSDKWQVEQGIKLSANNVGLNNRVWNLPLYMAMFL